MRHELSLFTLLMIVAYGLAFWASQPVEDSTTEKTALFSLSPKQIQSIRYQEDKLDVTLENRGDMGFWVNHNKTVVSRTNPHSPETKEAGAESDTKSEIVTTNFKASSKIDDELLQRLSPFEATRVVGKVADDRLEEFGISDDSAMFTIKSKDKEYVYKIGIKGYGSPFIFIQDQSDERILLVGSAPLDLVSSLDVRAYERQFVDFDDEEVTHAVAAAGQASLRMAHTERSKDGKLQWSNDGDKPIVNSTYQSWMDKVSRLRLTTYADAEKAEALSRVEPFLQVTYEKDGKVLDTVQLKKIEVPSETEGKTEAEYWGTSKYLSSYGRLTANRVGPIENDIPLIIKE